MVKLGHLIDEPGARRTLCGRRVEDVAITWKKFAVDYPQFETKHGKPWPGYPPCRECYERAGLAGLLPAPAPTLFDQEDAAAIVDAVETL